MIKENNSKLGLKLSSDGSGWADITIGNSGNGGVGGLKCACYDRVTGKKDVIHYHLSWPPGTWDDVWVSE